MKPRDNRVSHGGYSERAAPAGMGPAVLGRAKRKKPKKTVKRQWRNFPNVIKDINLQNQEAT